MWCWMSVATTLGGLGIKMSFEQSTVLEDITELVELIRDCLKDEKWNEMAEYSETLCEALEELAEYKREENAEVEFGVN